MRTPRIIALGVPNLNNDTAIGINYIAVYFIRLAECKSISQNSKNSNMQKNAIAIQGFTI
jgi:hypothetical protein